MFYIINILRNSLKKYIKSFYNIWRIIMFLAIVCTIVTIIVSTICLQIPIKLMQIAKYKYKYNNIKKM